MRDYRAELQEIFRDLFDDDEIQVQDQTTAADIDGWDSLNNIRLVVMIERHFGIQFSTGEVVGFKNVGELLRVIDLRVRG